MAYAGAHSYHAPRSATRERPIRIFVSAPFDEDTVQTVLRDQVRLPTAGLSRRVAFTRVLSLSLSLTL